MKKFHILIACISIIYIFPSCRCIHYYTPTREKNDEFKDNNIYFSLERWDAPYNRDYLYSLRISFREESQQITDIEVKIQIEKTDENLKLKQITPSLSLKVNDIDYNKFRVQQFRELPTEVKNTRVGSNNAGFCFDFLYSASGKKKAKKFVVLKYDITMANGERKLNEIKLKQKRHCFFAVH